MLPGHWKKANNSIIFQRYPLRPAKETHLEAKLLLLSLRCGRQQNNVDVYPSSSIRVCPINHKVSTNVGGASASRSIPKPGHGVKESSSPLPLTANANHSTSSSSNADSIVAATTAIQQPALEAAMKKRTEVSLPPPKKKRRSYGASSATSGGVAGTNGKASKSTIAEGISTGRWTDAEHQAFLRGLHLYGREWKKVASMISTRTSSQVRSHAQKYFTKMQRDQDAFLILSNAAAGNRSDSPAKKLGNATMPSHADSSSTAAHEDTNKAMSGLSPAVQATVARILSSPEAVEAEIEDTLQRLRERYTQLQNCLKQVDKQETAKQARENVPSAMLTKDLKHSTSSTTSELVTASRSNSSTGRATSLLATNEPLHQEELIAVAVLQGALPRSGSPQLHSTPQREETKAVPTIQKLSQDSSSLSLDSVRSRSPRKAHGFDLSPRPLKRKATILLQASAASSASPPLPYASCSFPPPPPGSTKQPTQ